MVLTLRLLSLPVSANRVAGLERNCLKIGESARSTNINEGTAFRHNIQ